MVVGRLEVPLLRTRPLRLAGYEEEEVPSSFHDSPTMRPVEPPTEPAGVYVVEVVGIAELFGHGDDWSGPTVLVGMEM